MYCVCTIFMQVFWSLCLYCVYKHRMPLTVVQFAHMHSHLVATKPLIAGCNHLSFKDSQHNCSSCLSDRCMPYLHSNCGIEKPGLANRQQVCATYVSFLQTVMLRTSWVQRFLFQAVLGSCFKESWVSVPCNPRFLFQAVLGS